MKIQAMELFTAAGINVVEALAALDRELPAEAYRPIESGPGKAAGLTDIIPAFMWELVTELFGPLSIGWGYEELEFQFNGKTAIVKVAVWYRTFDQHGKEVGEVKWTARGGNGNATPEWAIKGALTNALGAAWSLQGFQASVYKDLRTPDTLAKAAREKERAEALAKQSGKGQETQPAQAEGQPIPDPDTAPAPAETHKEGDLLGLLRARGVKIEDGVAYFGFSDSVSRNALKKAGAKWDNAKKGWRLPTP